MTEKGRSVLNLEGGSADMASNDIGSGSNVARREDHFGALPTAE